MKLNKLKLLFILLSLPLSLALGQVPETYLFPVNPGQNNNLAGTMGELRSSHFHAGIDIKTGGKEGLAVLATKSGYISRIKISTGGYGHALYVLHPDGHTSVYAHMKYFAPEVEAYVKRNQYEQETYEIELFPEAGQFAFKRGEELGKSGNTGGSTGPHLHFEIRDENQKVLNPLHYGFQEIKDNIPPMLQKLAISPKNDKSRIYHEAKRQAIPTQRTGFNYEAKDTISAYGEIGIELLSHDKLNGAANKNGVSIIELWVNDSLYYYQNIDSMSFATQRDIIVHYPYDVKMKEGSRYHRLYIADGNRLDFYHPSAGNGWLTIENDSIYKLGIKMYDPYKNQSTTDLLIKGEKPDTVLYKSTDFELDKIAYEITNQLLQVYLQTECLKENNTELSLKLADQIIGIQPSYYLENTAVYLWDLNKGLPESVLSCGPGLNINEEEVIPGTEKTISNEHMKVAFRTYSLYDTVYISMGHQMEKQDSLEFFTISPNTFPLKSYIDISLIPYYSYDQNKSAVYEVNDAGDFSYLGGEWTEEGVLEFNTRNFGEFTIINDKTAPSIERIDNTLYFKIDDELSGINKYDAYLNGEWLLLKYEPKDKLVWVEWPDADMTPKTGELELIVKDNAGNENSLMFNIN